MLYDLAWVVPGVGGGCRFLFSAKTQTFVNEARAESELMLKKRGRGWERAGMELTILCVCVSEEEEEEYQSGGRWDLKVIDESTLTEKLEHQKSAEHNNNNYKKKIIKNM